MVTKVAANKESWEWPSSIERRNNDPSRAAIADAAVLAVRRFTLTRVCCFQGREHPPARYPRAEVAAPTITSEGVGPGPDRAARGKWTLCAASVCERVVALESVVVSEKHSKTSKEAQDA